MLKNRRERKVSLGLEGLEGRNLLSTLMVTPRQGAHIDVVVPGIQGQHIGSVAEGIIGRHIDVVVPGIQGQHIG